ncbi:hypothetical protein [Streptomyces sp. NPDC003952]
MTADTMFDRLLQAVVQHVGLAVEPDADSLGRRVTLLLLGEFRRNTADEADPKLRGPMLLQGASLH